MKYFIFCIVTGLLYCTVRGIPTIDEAILKVVHILNKTVVNQIDLKSLADSQLLSNQTEIALKRKCEKTGNPQTYGLIKKAGHELLKCIKNTVNITELQKEVEIAKPKGDLDEVFVKYCDKKSIVNDCISKFITTMGPCLSSEEKESGNFMQLITQRILNFICFKNGRHIALFVHVKGPECFKSKKEAIKKCFNFFYNDYARLLSIFNPFDDGLDMLSSGLYDLDDITSLVFTKRTCRDINKLQICIVDELENCEDPTVSNLFDAILNYVRKVTPCVKK